MKRVFFFFVLALMLASCASTRKIQETTTSVSVDSVSVKETAKHESEKVVDTTRTEHGKVVITEIIFDTTPAPSPATDPDARASPDTSASDKPATTQTPAATVNIPGFGQVSGNIKSIRQTVLESDNETKGKSKESERQEESIRNANVSVAEENNQRVEQPAPDPKRWRYYFYLAAIGILVLLYLKRVPIINWIKRILSGLRRIF